MFIHFPGNEEVKKLLIDHGADLNARNEINLTPLQPTYGNLTYNNKYFKGRFLKLIFFNFLLRSNTNGNEHKIFRSRQ